MEACTDSQASLDPSCFRLNLLAHHLHQQGLTVQQALVYLRLLGALADPVAREAQEL